MNGQSGDVALKNVAEKTTTEVSAREAENVQLKILLEPVDAQREMNLKLSHAMMMLNAVSSF